MTIHPDQEVCMSPKKDTQTSAKSTAGFTAEEKAAMKERACFFQAAAKFNARYATFGFNDAAHLDEGAMWPTSFALTKLTAADEAKIAALVKKAVS
jgi:hypothetical protein